MGLPCSRLKIVGRAYRLRFFRKDEKGERMDRWGDCLRDDAQIRVHPELQDKPELFANTVLHEILHAIHHEMAVQGENEEQIVTQFANGLIGVFKENPRLLPWVNEQLKPAKKHAPQDTEE